ncbi:uncharacterized protein LOC106054847 [Biomphalaria glabrata]|uniref:Uncharacterized protein LOC106054847 n=1 Tax=Biomphalaria glabrata TaxID=6526 RepID=A0A9W2YCP5_BIOGL|nr:uncharacterized protein LOC106054847 [Biomphalaria glabrata]
MLPECSISHRLPTLRVVLLVAVFLPPHLCSGDEPRTAWTDDPPQMSTEKVLTADDTTKNQARLLLQTLLSNKFKYGQAGATLNDGLLSGTGQLESKVANNGHGIPASQNGLMEPSVNLNDLKVESQDHISHDLKFVPLTELQKQDNLLLENKQNEVARPNHSSADASKIDQIEATTRRPNSPANKNIALKENIAAASDSIRNDILSETLPIERLLDTMKDLSITSMEDPAKMSNAENLLQSAMMLLRQSKARLPFLEELFVKENINFDNRQVNDEDTRRDIVASLKPQELDSRLTQDNGLDTVISLKAKEAPLFHSRLTPESTDLQNSLIPKTEEKVANAAAEAARRSRRDLQSILQNATSLRSNATGMNSTSEQGKPLAAQEELKISRIGYIIFEKDGKIKEAKEASVSELRKPNNTMTPQRLHRKKLIQACRHENYNRPMGQPHGPQKLGGNNHPTQGQSDQRGDHMNPNTDLGKKFSDDRYNYNKLFGPNSIEILTIREDVNKGLAKKEFSDVYDVQVNGPAGREHHSFLSAFHVLLITAICIFTFVTILYLSSKFRSDSGNPKRLNSHTALFEANTKYERY